MEETETLTVCPGAWGTPRHTPRPASVSRAGAWEHPGPFRDSWSHRPYWGGILGCLGVLTSVPHPRAGPPGLPLVPSGDSRLGLGPWRGSGGGAVSTPSSRTGRQRATTCVRDTSPGRLGWSGLLPALLLINQRSASLGAQGPLTPPPSDERAEVQDAVGVTESPRFISVFCCVPGALSLSPPAPTSLCPQSALLVGERPESLSGDAAGL